MADLENLLLEAAGRTGGPGGNRRPPSRRRREGSYSDDGSDSKDDDSDDDLGYKSRKPSGSQVPLKKRLDPIEKDDDRDSQGDDGGYVDDEHRGGSSDDSDVGSDLYKGEEDRENLAQMTELEREYILSERATRRDDLKLKETVRAKQSGKKSEPVKETTPPPRLRSSARSADRAAAKDDALNELRLKRKKQQDPEGHWRSKDASRGVSSGWGSSPVKHSGILTASPSSSSQSESQSASQSRDDGSTGDGDLGDSDDDRMDDGRERPAFEDVKNITIKRSRLAKWLMEPFFEELIVGCFVRVGIGMSKTGKSIYRLCIVRNVDATDPNRQYRLENKSTYKYLNCVWGNESSAARWQMARVSDAAPLVEEFNEWVREVERSGGRMPTQQAVLEKNEAIQKTTNTFVYSAATVKQMLQEKKSATSRPMNIAAEKQRLRREMDVAESRRDEAEMERLQARLQELEAMSRQVKDKDSKAVRLAEMNKKNRAENFKNASELKPVNTSLKAGEAGYDPFSRRWTRSMNYYVSKPGGGDETAASANGNEVSEGTGSGRNKNGERTRVEAGIAATVAALEAAADAGKLVDTNAPVDRGTESNSLHDFELPVSLAGLQKFGGPHGAHAGFLARKQRIEATVGCRVPENDGRRHALTLTVSDYKRRRGLL